MIVLVCTESYTNSYKLTNVEIQVRKFNQDKIKSSWDPNHFIFEINGGKSRIRHRTALNLNGIIFNWFWVNLEIQFQSRSMADPTLSDIDFKNKLAWVWTTLKLGIIVLVHDALLTVTSEFQ